VVELAGDVVRDRPPRLIAAAAQRAFETVLASADLVAGVAEPVRSPAGATSYWLVPGVRGGSVVAFARVLPDGRLATVGELRAPAVDVAQAATGLSAEQARVALGTSEPQLVHDGPVGREAWLAAVADADGNERWVFATGGGTYERPAGALLDSG
jgi:hypothetical protein